jgi:hypothetical protein
VEVQDYSYFEVKAFWRTACACLLDPPQTQPDSLSATKKTKDKRKLLVLRGGKKDRLHFKRHNQQN